MQRREFLAAGAAVVAAVTTSPLSRAQASASAGSSPLQWIEIRTYHFASPDKQKTYEQFLTTTAIPAFGRAGVKPAGIFRELAADNPKLNLKEDSTDLWLILGHDSAESYAAFESRLGADEAYQSAGKEILLAGKDDPAFTHYDTELLVAFEAFPRMKPRDLKETRVLEMRSYQSRNQERAANKISMFNRAEIPIFERVGMPGIFWGRAIAGPDLPHLTYMVWHESMEQSPKDWKAFGADAEWTKLKAEPQYTDNVSKIVNRFLRPVAGSEI